jgi:hypothetical protein
MTTPREQLIEAIARPCSYCAGRGGRWEFGIHWAKCVECEGLGVMTPDKFRRKGKR